MKKIKLLKNGKLLNRLIAAGSLFGASMFAPRVEAAPQINSNIPIVRTINKNSSSFVKVSLSKEESDIANTLYFFISRFSKSSSINDRLLEMKFIAQTVASYTVKFKMSSSYTSLQNMGCLRKNSEIIESYDKNDKLMSLAINYAKTLMSDPESIQWKGDLYKAPVIFTFKSCKPVEDERFEYKERVSTNSFTFYIVNPKLQAPETMTDEENFLARVIYSETGSECSEDEFKMVCKVIMNRIGNKDFGFHDEGKIVAAKNAYEVVKVKNAFSPVRNNNVHWNNFEKLQNDPYVIRCKIYAKEMLTKNASTINLIGGDEIVYFHDKSITLPNKWINKYWLPVKVVETEHFIFYKVVRNVNHLTAAQYKAQLNKK